MVIREDLEKTGDVVINCCYLNLDIAVKLVSVELHGLADASIAAYGCVIYFTFLYPDEIIHISTVTSKYPVPLAKLIAISILQLQATVLLSNHMEIIFRLISVIASLLKVVCWSDSKIV